MYDSIQMPTASSSKPIKAAVIAYVGFVILCTPLNAQEDKDDPAITGHATVHIVFAFPHESDPTIKNAAGPNAQIGNRVLRFQSIRPVSISIDGEFVGHALPGFSEIKPVYVLPHGKHRFEFVCDGFKTVKSVLTVIGTGSKQYLIVKLESHSPESPNEKTTKKSPDLNKPQ